MAATVSKFMSFAFEPLYHWAFLAALCFLFAAFNRQAINRVAGFLVAYIAIVIFTPVPLWMLQRLENAYAVPSFSPAKSAVVVLTGGTLEYNTAIDQFAWYERADRIMVPVRNWADSESLFLITGKDTASEKLPPFKSETESMGMVVFEAGVPVERILLETEARSTRENAHNAVALLTERGITDFYLVTSAFHMPRSVRSFRAAGLEPTPYPVDFMVTGRPAGAIPSIGAQNYGYFKIALHEYVGSLYYWGLDFFGRS